MRRGFKRFELSSEIGVCFLRTTSQSMAWSVFTLFKWKFIQLSVHQLHKKSVFVRTFFVSCFLTWVNHISMGKRIQPSKTRRFSTRKFARRKCNIYKNMFCKQEQTKRGSDKLLTKFLIYHLFLRTLHIKFTFK